MSCPPLSLGTAATRRGGTAPPRCRAHRPRLRGAAAPTAIGCPQPTPRLPRQRRLVRNGGAFVLLQGERRAISLELPAAFRSAGLFRPANGRRGSPEGLRYRSSALVVTLFTNS